MCLLACGLHRVSEPPPEREGGAVRRGGRWEERPRTRRGEGRGGHGGHGAARTPRGSPRHRGRRGKPAEY